MKKIIKKYILLYLVLITVFFVVNFLGTNSFRRIFVDGDGSGHYAYLPSLIIYQSVNFEDVYNLEKQHKSTDYMGHNYHKHGSVLINKFSAGTALLQLPFFLFGILLSIIFGLPVDGYNIVFQYSVAMSTLFWSGLGLIYFVKLARIYNVKLAYTWMMAAAGLFGTNLFFYIFVQPSFSHAYSFSLISMFLYYSKMVFVVYKKRYVLIASFLLGLIVLVRPVNLIIIASLPFIAGTPQNFINAIKQKLTNIDVLPAVLLFLVAISPQLIINYLQTGSIILYGYKNEGFYFSDPQIINFLFSYKKGWFVYSPLFLLLFPAVIYLWRRQSVYAFAAFVLFLLIQVYVFSSWWNWYYGDSFGMRPLVDYYGLYFLVIALLLYNISYKWVKIVVVVFVLIVTVLNVVQSYQYSVGIIHPDSMTKKAYWHVFFKVEEKFKRVISGGDETFYGKLHEKPFFITNNYIDDFDDGWTIPIKTKAENAYSDSLSVIQDQEHIYSPSFKFIIVDTLVGYNNIYVRFKTQFYEFTQNAALKAVFVVDFTDTSGNNVFYKTFPVKQLPDDVVDVWQLGSIGFKLPVISPNVAFIKFYIWNVEKHNYLLDDISLQLYTYN